MPGTPEHNICKSYHIRKNKITKVIDRGTSLLTFASISGGKARLYCTGFIEFDFAVFVALEPGDMEPSKEELSDESRDKQQSNWSKRHSRKILLHEFLCLKKSEARILKLSSDG